MGGSRSPSAAATTTEPHLRVVPGTGRDDDLTGALLLGPRTDSGLLFRGVGWPAALAAAQDRVRAAASQADALLEELVGAASSLVDAAASAALLEGSTLLRKAATAGGLDLLVGDLVPTEGTVCGAAVASRRAVMTGGSTPATVAGAPGIRGVGDPSGVCCPGARSHLAIPLVDGGAVLGVLALTSDQPGWFDESDESSVSLLAGVAARALAGLPLQRDGVTLHAGGVLSGALAPEVEALGAASRHPPPASLHGLGLWSWDAATGQTTCSPSVADLLGLTPHDQLSLDHLRNSLHPDDLPRFETALTRQLAGAPGVAGTFRVKAPDGERQVHAWGEVRRSRSGAVTGAWGAAVDVTDRERQAATLRSTLAGLRAAQELTGLGVWEWHPREGRLEWSPEMFRIAGLEPGEAKPSLELWHRLIHPDDRARAMRLDELADEGGGTVETFRVHGMDGQQRHVQAWSTVIPADGASSRVVAGAVVDVSRQVEDRVELERRSSTDPVTKLANRLGFERLIKGLLGDDRGDVGLLLLDLDRFKMVNDSLGHQVGDRLLVEVARRLESVAPAGSLTARMGGDEFLLVPPPGVGWRELRTIAQDVVEALRVPFSLNDNGEVLFCPASVGVTCTSGRRVDIDVLLSEADLALYRAKDDGRDRYAVFDGALRERARGRHRAEQLLRAALEENRLVLQYQPIVDFTHGRVVGAEALVRMRADDGETLLPPESFIDVAEDIGLVVELDCWVLETALSQLARWLMHAPSAQVPWLAVNVSPRSMEHPRIVRTLLDGLEVRGLPPHLLKVELTESSFLSSLPGGEKALQKLIRHQIPVGIDDFGTGYSALAYLTRFELDFMKIDRSFVSSVGQDARADAVVTAIVALAHAHGMKVTAEGVETPRQARRLREIGCDFAQGYHFGRPGDASRILRG